MVCARLTSDDARLPCLSALQARGILAEDHAVLVEGGPWRGQCLLYTGAK